MNKLARVNRAAMRISFGVLFSETAQVIPKFHFHELWDQKAKLSEWQAPRIASATRVPTTILVKKKKSNR